MNGIGHYEEIRKNFQWNVPDNFNFGRDVVDRYTSDRYPRDIVFANELPKTSSGKIRRVELRNAEWKRA